MIKNLLRPKWQHPDAAVRHRAITEGRLDADVLFELAKIDPEPGIRSLAVSHMQDLQQLIAVAEYSPEANDSVPARLHELLLAADRQVIPDTQILKRCFDLCSSEQQRQSLLLHAPYVALRQMAAECVQQDEVLAQCVMNDIASEVRRAAVLRITNEDTLQQVARQLRGSDKTTARLADEVRAKFQQQREQAEQRRTLLTELQAYTEGTKPLNEAVVNERFRQWASLADDADADEKSRFEIAFCMPGYNRCWPSFDANRNRSDRAGRCVRTCCRLCWSWPNTVESMTQRNLSGTYWTSKHAGANYRRYGTRARNSASSRIFRNPCDPWRYYQLRARAG